MDDQTFKRFFDKVELDAEGCWMWVGGVAGGYGAIWNGRGHDRAHIVSYDHFRGPYVKVRRMVLDHTCKKKLCVNPWCLEHITQAVNMQRAYAHRR